MATLIPIHSESTHTEIAGRARAIFELEGSPSGRELGHWLQAEAEFREVSSSHISPAYGKTPDFFSEG